MKIFLKILIITFIFFLAISSAKASILATPSNNLGLVGYWAMEDGSGSIATDHSGNGNGGTLTNMEAGDWVDGIRGGALDFDGSSDYVVIVDDDSLDAVSNEISYVAWVKVPELSYRENIVGRQLDVNNQIILGTGSTNQLVLFVKTANSQNNVSTGSALTINEWVHIAGTASTDTLSLYINGEFATSTANTKTLITSGDIRLGKAEFDGSYFQDFKGKLDDVRIYNRTLSATEVYNLYNQGQVTINPAPGTGLIAYYAMEDGSGTSLTDHSGNRNTGTLTNMEAGDWVDGIRGRALDFDGSNEYVDIPDYSSLTGLIGSTSFWFKTSTTGSRPWASSDEAGDIKYISPIITSDVLQMQSRNSGTDRVAGDTVITDGQWHFGVITSDGSAWAIYVDGEAEGLSIIEGTNTGDWFSDIPDRDNFHIGVLQRNSGFINYFNGEIDELRFYNRTLTSTEVKGLYNQGQVTINPAPGTGLVGYWAMEDGSGSIATDHSGNENNGTLTNMEAEDWVDGIRGKALDFDGSNEYVDISDSAELDNMSEITLSAWIYPEGWGESNYGRIISKRHYTDASYEMGVFNGGGEKTVFAAFYGDSDAISVTASNNAIALNSWYHVVATNDGSNQVVYVNGVSVGTGSTSTGDIERNVGVAVNIGKRLNSSSDRFFNGLIDEVHIWDRALSASEILNLYNTKR